MSRKTLSTFLVKKTICCFHFPVVLDMNVKNVNRDHVCCFQNMSIFIFVMNLTLYPVISGIPFVLFLKKLIHIIFDTCSGKRFM